MSQVRLYVNVRYKHREELVRVRMCMVRSEYRLRHGTIAVNDGGLYFLASRGSGVYRVYLVFEGGIRRCLPGAM